MRLHVNFRFCSLIADSFKFFNIRRWLSCREVRLHVKWVNAKWVSTSTELTWNETSCQLSQCGMIKIFVNVGAFCVDSVDVESHSVLTQLTWSLTPRWLSWRGVSLRVDSVCERWIKPKQAYTTNSGTFERTEFRKINYEMFKQGQYQPEKAKSKYVAWCKKLTLRSLSRRRVPNNSNISANLTLYFKQI
jgi:hypothetical protein